MTPLDSILRLIRQESDGLSQGAPDEVLLERFVTSRDEPAFEELLKRYGPMVMRIARRAMTERAAAEDVFQATFLALVGRAGTIRRREAVGTWLARVAFQIAKRSLRDKVRNRNREAKSAKSEAVPPAPDSDGIGPMLDEELNRLPEKYRQALVLCCILKRPYAVAAQELGLSAPAVWKRVRKGQDMLRRRLDARGVAVASTTVAAVLASGSDGRAEVASSIPEVIRSAACLLKGTTEGVPAHVIALAGVEATGSGGTLRVGVVGLLGLVSASAIAFASLTPRVPAPQMPLEPQQVPQTRPAAVEALVEIFGVVRGPGGRPQPGARVTLLTKEYLRGEANGSDRALATGLSDDSGRYRLSVPPFPAPIAEARRLTVFTTDRSGSTVASQELTLPLGSKGTSLDLLLGNGRTIRGRVLDRFGLPVPGATVGVTRIGTTSINPIVGVPESYPPGWPAAVVTDASGGYELAGLDPSTEVKLAIEPRNHAYAVVVVPPEKTDRVVIAVGPVRKLVGQVKSAASGSPVPHARVIVTGPMRSDGMAGRKVRADAQGKFVVSLPDEERFAVQAHAPDGLPLLPVSETVVFGSGDRSKSVEVTLPTGVAIRGEVRDAEGSPVGGCVVQYLGRSGPGTLPGVISGGSGFVTASADGRFTVVVPPKHGTLLVYGPSLEFRPETADMGLLRSGTPSGLPVYAHAVVPLTVDADSDSPPVRVSLKRGSGIDIRVLGPDGSPMPEGMLMCRHLTWPFEFRTATVVPFQNGSARLPGCVPGRRYTVVVSDTQRTLGAIADLVCPQSPSEPVTLRLRPTGEVTGRVVRTDNRSPVGTPYSLTLQLPRDVPDEATALAERVSDPTSGVLTGNTLRSAGPPIGADGRVRVPGLIPGARYRFGVLKGDNWSWVEFEVAAGKSAVLPAIVLESLAGSD